MFTNLRRICTDHLRSNITYYVLILCGFVCGGIIAAVCVFGMNDLSHRELTIYFDDFFKSTNSNGADCFAIFKMAVMSNLRIYIVILLLSLTVIGMPLLVVVSSVLGYSFWFTVIFVIKAYGVKGLLFIFGAIFPHQLILLPCLAVSLMIGIQHSVLLFKGKKNIRTMMVAFIVKTATLFLISLFAALLEGYVEPVFLELMAPLFLTIG